ncbi:MAG: ATP-binding protein [bacterium]
MINNIFPRIIIDEIKKFIFTDEIIVLHGARQVGKTHLLYLIENYLEETDNKFFYIDLEDSRFADILDKGINEFLKYLTEQGFNLKKFNKNKKFFVLIDEIQYLKNPSSFLKLIADHHNYLKLIVSGSSSFEIKSKFKNSLAGRTINFEIFPLSFEEFLIFKNYSNPKVINEKKLTDKTISELRDFYKDYALYGGYPKIVLTDDIELKEKYLQQIIDTYVKKDIRDLANVKDIDKFNKLLEVLASQSGSLLEIKELSDTVNLAAQTVGNYLFILENTYIIKMVRPFHKNIRSELFKTAKIFFYDSGLAQMLWLKRLQKEILGSVFETNIFGQLVKLYGKENILYWRTTDKKEIDFIIKKDNKILPIEAKLNFAGFNKTASEYFCEKYNTDYAVTALDGEPTDIHYKYPWEI